MICVVLAAGYATRLYPLTRNFPKPLLEVGGKPILDWLLDDVDADGSISRYVVVSNHRYAEAFRAWARGKTLRAPVEVLDDGSTENENRLGAVVDIRFAVEKLGLDDDLLVVAGDNVLDFSLRRFLKYFREKQAGVIMRYFEPDERKLSKCGVVDCLSDGLVRSMEEKPEQPKTHWCVPPFYIYPKRDLPLIAKGIEAGCKTDAPGSFAAWLCGQAEVYAMKMPGRRYDVGNLESYEAIRASYKGLSRKCLVTGAAGFIGFHLSKRLLEEGWQVCAIDNVNSYYDVRLKRARLAILEGYEHFRFTEGDLKDEHTVMALFEAERPDVAVNLAAQPGVRYSLENPRAYIDSNIVGFLNLLEACRKYPVEHLLYASSSSVYGNQQKTPFSTDDPVDHPVSLYAATKKADELMAYTYSHLFGIPATGLRFFTVYGPFGRPDMAVYSFTRKILAGEPIQVFNGGDMYRDFTYVDDIVEGIVNMLRRPPEEAEGARHKVYNIGNNHPERVSRFIELLEEAIGREAVKVNLPMQPGDVYQTYADIGPLERDFGFRPSTPLSEGLKRFAAWYREFYGEAKQ